MRASGLTQLQVAELLGTTKSNVSAVEIAARRNIERARRTLEQAALSQARLRVAVPAGTDVNRVPTMVFGEADTAGVHLSQSGPAIIAQLIRDAGDWLRGRLVMVPFEVIITDDGNLHFIGETK